MSFNLRALLQKPHPFIFNRYSVLVPGTVTFLIIFLFKPNGFQVLPFGSLLGHALAFGAIVSLCVWGVVKGLQWGLPGWMKEEQWTLGKELLLFFSVLTLIACVIFGMLVALNISDQPALVLLRYTFFNTLLISLFPIFILVLFEQFNHQKAQLKRAQAFNEQLQENQKSASVSAESKPVAAPPATLKFEAENGKVTLQLKPSEVLFLKSDGNYVEVFYTDAHQKMQKALIRNRLKAFISFLPAACFFHCHKSYVVNGQHIVQVEGNARNFELTLRGTELKVPVSRSKAEALSTFLSAQR